MRWPGRWEGKWWGGGKKLISSELSSSQGLKLSPLGFIFLCMCHTTVRYGWSKASLAENVGRVLVQLQSSRLGRWERCCCPEDTKFFCSVPEPALCCFNLCFSIPNSELIFMLFCGSVLHQREGEEHKVKKCFENMIYLK